MKRAQQWLGFVFWVAFASFLAASVPHVAYFFRAYEPVNPAEDVWWWFVSFSIAVSIDVVIFLLSVTVASLHKQRKSKKLIASVWIFIIGMAVLSWYINERYAIHFRNTAMLSAVPLNIGSVEVPDINPVIASAFQALAIAYTWISDKITSGAEEKSAVELEAEAKELEAKLSAKKRISAAKKEERNVALGGVAGSAADALSGFGNAFGRVDLFSERNRKLCEQTLAFFNQYPSGTDEQLALFLKVKGASQAHYWRLQAEVWRKSQEAKNSTSGDPFDDESGTDTSEGEEDGTSTRTEVGRKSQFRGKGSRTSVSTSMKRKSTRKEGLTAAEAAAEIGCTDRNIRTLRASGTLKTVAGTKLLEWTSVMEYAKRKHSTSGHVENGNTETGSAETEQTG